MWNVRKSFNSITRWKKSINLVPRALLSDSPILLNYLLTCLGKESSRAILIKSFHTTWSNIAPLICLELSGLVSALMVSMYVVLGVPRFGWPCWGSQRSTLEAVSSLWREQWPANVNLLARIVSLILCRLPYSSWLFILLPLYIQGCSQHSVVASIDTFLQLLGDGPRFTSKE